MSYVATNAALPLSLDVQVSVSKLATMGRLSLSTLCLVSDAELNLLPDASRIRFYSNLAGVASDFGTTSEPYYAAVAFFSQNPAPSQMAVAQAWLSPTKGMLIGTGITAADLTALALITSGTLSFTFAGVAYNLTGLNFSTVTDLASAATIIQTKLTTQSITAITASVKTLAGGVAVLNIASAATGATVTVAYAAGTAAPLLSLDSAANGAYLLPGYAPTDIGTELTNIQNAASAAGKFIYGWCLGATLRDAAHQTVAAVWAGAQTAAVMPLVCMDPSALSSGFTTDIGSVVKATANKRVFPVYSTSLTEYPDVSILAYMLSVNYSTQDATVTAKFKTLPACTPVVLSLTDWTVLQSKGYNVYSTTGLNALVYREGTTADESTPWFLDTVINMDNFIQDLSANVYNVFLRNGKVPYTVKGQLLLVDACRDTANQYTYNGTFADRQVIDTTNKAGVSNVPAVTITPTPISSISAATRATRVGPPIALICQEAGAIHSIAVNVQVVS